MTSAIRSLQLAFLVLVGPIAWSQTAPPITESGVTGGLAVWIGGDVPASDWADQLASLGDDGGWLVLGLTPHAPLVAATQAELARRGVYGPISVDLLKPASGSLPLIDDSVNLLVVSNATVSRQETLRVLAPLGVALTHDGSRWSQITKPWPDDIDEWTHYLHDPSNNAVAHDQRIGPPRHLQWQAGPRWGRHHDHMASVSAMVSARGRVFSIVDEGSRVSPQLPPDWKLVARNAFNGVLLWKLPIPRWHDHLWPLKSGPANLPRRLVAVEDVVYTTLGIDAPVTALDAASGDPIREYTNTSDAEEILRTGGVLLVLVNRTPYDLDVDLADDPEEGKSRDHRTTYSPTMARIWAGVRSKRWTHGDRVLRAFDAASGKPLWEKEDRILPITLAADGDGVYYHDGEKIVALELETGRPCWNSEPVPVWQGLDNRGLQSWFAPSLVAKDGLVLFAGGEKIHMSYVGFATKDLGQDTMTAFAADSGKKLWTADHPYSGYNSPEDLFLVDGKVWAGVTGNGGADGRYLGRDLASGELTDNFPPTVDAFWFHHRCYPAKATDRYVLSSRTGIEFIDLQTGEWTINHWVRGGCLYGIMPANGLIYAPPSPCACYPEGKLNGFAVLAAASASRSLPDVIALEERLEKGPAYDEAIKESETEDADNWPTYRHDTARSGGTASDISADLQQQWSIELGGRLTQPIAADGRLFVADVDRHAIHAVDADSGEKLWSYVAGGRVDSPPTYALGRLLFGSANGYVYCIRATDGVLLWRFRAAPADRRLVAFDQVESVWPVHGSILVQDGVASFVAGRSIYLDGGLRLCRLDARTGRLLGEKILGDRDPDTGEDMQVHIKGLSMPVSLPDILSSDGRRLFMRSQAMDLEGNRLGLGIGPGNGGYEHLFAAFGMTDDSYFHRAYWLYGDGFLGGAGGYTRNGKVRPGGRILANNDTTVFGYGRKQQYFRWTSVMEYQLFAAAKPGGNSGAPRFVRFANSPSLNPTGKPLTIAAWIKTESRDGTLLARGANLNGFALILTDGKPSMLLRTKETTHQVVGSKPVGADWIHIAGVLGTDGRMEVYLDGKSVGSIENVPTLGGEPSIPMKVGYEETGQLLPKPLVPYSGAIDDVMLFHRALAPEEIGRLALRETKFDEQALREMVLHLTFSNGKPRDRSPAANHGQISGPAAATVEGPFGDALLLEQPKDLILPSASQAGSSVAYRWTQDIPLTVRAMALAGKTLVIAGPADLIDEEAAFQSWPAEATQRRLREQDAALDGLAGAMMQVIDTETGKTLTEVSLDSPPVFDGLIVSGGRVFLTTMDGRLEAFSP